MTLGPSCSHEVWERQEAAIASNDPEKILQVARDAPGADIVLLQEAVIGCRNAETMILFAFFVPGSDVERCVRCAFFDGDWSSDEKRDWAAKNLSEEFGYLVSDRLLSEIEIGIML